MFASVTGEEPRRTRILPEWPSSRHREVTRLAVSKSVGRGDTRRNSPRLASVMRQCEPQRIKGWFYLPESSDDRKPGILTWQPDEGATLELIGGFSPEPNTNELQLAGCMPVRS